MGRLDDIVARNGGVPGGGAGGGAGGGLPAGNTDLQQFRIFRALGLSFAAWGRNFLPFTLLAAVLYAPVVVWAVTLPGADKIDEIGANALAQKYVTYFEHGTWVLVGLSTLLAPLITYRVVQHLNGNKVPMTTSMKYGVRGFLPAVIVAGVTNVLQLVPFGGILAVIVMCYWFVAAPAGVAEKIGVGSALSRSAALTDGRRGGIFLLNLLLGIAMVAVVMVWLAPLLNASDKSPAQIITEMKSAAIAITIAVAVFQLFVGIVQAVSYTLLRTDKDGLSYDEIAAVFG